MPRFGAHTSVAGGLYRCMESGQEAGCEVVQLFSKSERQWVGKPILPEDTAQFAAVRERTGVEPVMIHDSYLINLSSPKDDLWERSIAAFREELERARFLGVPFLNMHPGSHVGSGVEAGLERMVIALDRVGDAGAYEGVTVLLETTAGQGTNLGSRFEEIGYLLAQTRHTDHFGVCLDTCHVFAAGYDLRTPEAYADTMAQFDRHIGIGRLKALHLNDALQPFGDRKDRHAHIGEGHIGREGFRAVVNDPRLAALPMVLETPNDAENAGYRQDLATLRGLVESSEFRVPSSGSAVASDTP